MTQNPFSFYDFLGYLIPGGLFLFILFLFSIEINPVYIEGILNHILKYKEIISVFIYVVLIGNDSNLLIVFYVQIMPDDLVMQLHRF
ncbi:hypothetical protein SK67_01577 [Escherichia coli]|nr:hypothetical protein SK67_01577 [Escherichia coli]